MSTRKTYCFSPKMDNLTPAAKNQRLCEHVDHLKRTIMILLDSIAQISGVSFSLSQTLSSTGCPQEFQEPDLSSASATTTSSRTSSISSTPEVSRKRKDAQASTAQAPLATLSPRRKRLRKGLPSHRGMWNLRTPTSFLMTPRVGRRNSSWGKRFLGEKKERTPQQCLACGLFDPNRNIGRHFKQVHSESFSGTRWVRTLIQHDVLPASSRPSVDTVKDWNGIKWDWIGLPKPHYDDDISEDDSDSGTENEISDTVQYGGKSVPRDAAMELLYRGMRKDIVTGRI